MGWEPGATAANAMSDSSIGLTSGGVTAGAAYIASQNAAYLFFAQGVAAGGHSSALIFTSPNDYDMGGAFISGGITGGKLLTLPTPTVPEPVTIALLACGACIIRGWKKRA